MNRRVILRRRPLISLAVGFLLFLVLLILLTDLSRGDFARVLAASVLAWTGATIFTYFFKREDQGSHGSPAQLLNRITRGDVAFTSHEIEAAAGSAEMASAVHGLVLNLERTIGRFAQLSADVQAVSDQISKRSRALAKISTEQLRSAEVTASSVTQIDSSIHSVQKSMENLSLNAEETSTSILQMSASIEEVGRIADTLSEFVEATASAIEEMIASINEVATNTETFSSFAIQTASSMVQMNATTVEIGKSARQSSDFARYVREAANEGREAVRGTVDGMRKIQDSVEEAKSALSMLSERSQEIGEIVRVIDEIAGQTNLLALNAAIIAAQAGERGRGFAVVADEIRDLSERTSVSTEEIRTLIQNVQRGVDRATDQMSSSSERVTEGVGLTARAHQVLEKILDLTEKSTSSISEIAKATEEQIRGSEAATKAIEEVTKMVQQTAVATQEQSQTSRKIGDQAALVRDYTKHLKRAMQEQESGSRAISRAMENIMTAVGSVVESTSVLTAESSSIVRAMGTIEQGTRESNFAVSALSQMSNTLRHESSLLGAEIKRFHLPEAAKGGRATTAIILPHPLTLDPAFCQFLALGFIQRAIHENLVTFGEGAELVPGVADRWEVLEHGLVYRFHLRRGACFHNGRLVNARDVANTFNRLLDPKLDSPGAWLVKPVVGADEVLAGKASTAEGIKVIDDETVEFHLKEPLAFFLLLLSMQDAAIVPIEEARNADRYAFKGTGIGPFMVENADSSSVRLIRNPQYFDKRFPHLDALDIRLDLKSAKDVGEAFLRKELDVAHGIPLTLVSELREDPRYAPYVLDNVQLHTSYLAWDTGRPPFDKLEVRQAMWHAVNRDRINDVKFQGLGVVAHSILPPGLMGYDPGLRAFSFDPDRAKALLRQGGYANGFDIDYWTWDTDQFFNSGMVDMIIEDLAAVGIRVKVSHHTANEVRQHHLKPGHNTLITGNWYADFPDSDNFFYMFFHSDSPTIRGTFYKKQSLDEMIEEARRTSDTERRTEIYRELNQLTLKDAPMLYLFHDRLFVAHQPHLRGVRTYLVPPPVRYHNMWVER